VFLGFGLSFSRRIWPERKSVLWVRGNGRLPFSATRHRVLKFIALRRQKQMREFARFA
jgi:hypothetical protein